MRVRHRGSDRLTAVFTEQSRDKEHVVNAGQQRQGENRSVESWQVVASPDAGLGTQNYGGDRNYLDDRADLSQGRGTKGPESRDHIDRGGADYDENVSADDCNHHPKRYRQMLWKRDWKNSPH